mgnify:CR=1 FL=1
MFYEVFSEVLEEMVEMAEMVEILDVAHAGALPRELHDFKVDRRMGLNPEIVALGQIHDPGDKLVRAIADLLDVQGRDDPSVGGKVVLFDESLGVVEALRRVLL